MRIRFLPGRLFVNRVEVGGIYDENDDWLTLPANASRREIADAAFRCGRAAGQSSPIPVFDLPAEYPDPE